MTGNKKTPLWVVILAALVWLGLQWYSSRTEPAPTPGPAATAPSSAAPLSTAPRTEPTTPPLSAAPRPKRATAPPSAAPRPSRAATAPSAPARPSAGTRVPGGPRIQQVDGVTVRAYGKVVHTGKVDLRPTIRRILAGERHRHRNDGSVFQNRERRLPRRPRGAYREYVHPTPGIRGAGPQRLVVDRDGPWYYTPDHYKTFKSLQP